MKNLNDIQSNGGTKIFPSKESSTKIYEIPSKKSTPKNSQEETENYSENEFDYDIADMFNCFD